MDEHNFRATRYAYGQWLKIINDLDANDDEPLDMIRHALVTAAFLKRDSNAVKEKVERMMSESTNEQVREVFRKMLDDFDRLKRAYDGRVRKGRFSD